MGGKDGRNNQLFSKSWNLVAAAPIIRKATTAKLMNGVLTVTIPKDQQKMMEEKAKKIPVFVAVNEKSNADVVAVESTTSDNIVKTMKGSDNDDDDSNNSNDRRGDGVNEVPVRENSINGDSTSTSSSEG